MIIIIDNHPLMEGVDQDVVFSLEHEHETATHLTMQLPKSRRSASRYEEIGRELDSPANSLQGRKATRRIYPSS